MSAREIQTPRKIVLNALKCLGGWATKQAIDFITPNTTSGHVWAALDILAVEGRIESKLIDGQRYWRLRTIQSDGSYK